MLLLVTFSWLFRGFFVALVFGQILRMLALEKVVTKEQPQIAINKYVSDVRPRKPAEA